MATWPLSLLALTISMTLVTRRVEATCNSCTAGTACPRCSAPRRARSASRCCSPRTTASNVRPIATVQTVRLFVLIVALPAAFGLAGVGGLPPRAAHVTESLPEYLMRSRGADRGVRVRRMARPALPASRRPDGRLDDRVRRAAWRRLSSTSCFPWPVITACLVATGALIGARLGTVDRAQLVRLSVAGSAHWWSRPRSPACSR